MATTEPLPLPGNHDAKVLLLLCLTAILGILLVFYVRPELPAAAPTAYAVPGILIAALVLAIRVSRAGAASTPWVPLLFGLAFIVGGAAFDITATVAHTPDLSQEQNPIARVLLDGGHSLSFVYWYGLICQPLYLAFVAFLWVGLLRHRHSILDSVRGSHTFLQLVKAATGGLRLTWRQWCLPLRLSELPNAYHLLWVLAVILIAGSMDRWYLGVEWYGFLAGARWVIFCISVAGGLGLYFVWLWRMVRNLPADPVAAVAAADGGRDVGLTVS
jgi:hypothetical protein